jgi:hypothetical protein
MSYSLEWRCPACHKPDVVELDAVARDETGELRCHHCALRQSFPAGTRSSDGSWADPLQRCLSCGSERLFVQKDFNRKLGLAIVVVGAVLSPWTYGASLVVCMLIDYGLYYLVPEITVCYGCDAIHRGFEHNPTHRAHDPILAERFRRKAQEETAVEIPEQGAGGGVE